MENETLNNYFMYENNLIKHLDNLNLENNIISKKKISVIDIKNLGYEDRIKFRQLLRKNHINSLIFKKRHYLK